MRYSKKTRMSPEDIMTKAKEHFGKAGLSVTEETSHRVCLEGADGFVTVQLRSLTGDEMDVITEGFDQRVKDFLKVVK